MLLLATVGGAEGLRCYVCGGHSGTPCRGGVGDTTALDTDTERQDQDPVQECTDLINNRGCVKQFVNGGNYLKSNEVFVLLKKNTDAIINVCFGC